MLRHVVVRHPGTGAGRRSPPLPPNNANHCECARTLRGGFASRARREATPVLADSAASGQAVRAVRARLGAAANAAAPRSLRLVHPPVVVRATTGSAVVEVRAVTPRPTRTARKPRGRRVGAPSKNGLPLVGRPRCGPVRQAPRRNVWVATAPPSRSLPFPLRDTRERDGYLVDPASSYMLVSKIKPCMSKYIPRHGETAKGSLNQLWFLRSYNPTWITVAILELIHATQLRPSRGERFY